MPLVPRGAALAIATAAFLAGGPQVSAQDTTRTRARAFLRVDLSQSFWGSPDGRCRCTPVTLDVGAGVRLRRDFDLGAGVGLSGDALEPLTWGLDAGAYLRPDHALRLAGRYRGYFPGKRGPVTDTGERLGSSYRLAQVTLQAYPFGGLRPMRGVYLLAGFALSRQSSGDDDFGYRVLRKEVRRGPVIGLGWGPR